MKGKILALFLGFAVALSLVASAQRTGGFPSRPRFQAVTLGAGTLAGTGDVRINAGSLGVGTAPNASDGRITISGEYNANSGSTVAFMTADSTDAYFGSRSAHGVRIRSSDTDRVAIASNGDTDFFGVHNEIENTSPYLSLHDSDQAAGNRIVLVQNTGGQFLLRFCNDAISACGNFLTANRSDNTATVIDMVATAVTANGSTVWTAGNDGAGSGLDADTLDGISSAGFLQSTRDIVTQTAISGASMAVGDTITISKAAATSRASTIADTNDPDLQITALPAGHYVVDFQVDFNQGGGGVRYRLEAPSANSGLYGVQNCASTVTATNGAFDGLVQCAGTLRAFGNGASAKAQASGTLAISWAQNTSNAANTTLEADSYLRVKRIN